VTQPLPSPAIKTDRGRFTFRELGLVMNPLRIPAAKEMLSGEGVSAWARRNGFRPKAVHDVLSGTRPCIRGESHRIAKALGLFDR
jgi:gp16 family phage-associated protein